MAKRYGAAVIALTIDERRHGAHSREEDSDREADF